MAKDCNGLNKPCTATVGPDYGLNPDGTIPEGSTQCSTSVDGRDITVGDINCSPFDLQNNRNNDFVEGVIEEALNIGGATLNVYKLLGVHEQGKLVDCTGRGDAISNGDAPSFPASNAFDKYVTEWRSVQTGTGVTASAYLGYDFGNIKTYDASRSAYGVETSVFKHVATIAIKQSSEATRRATRVRIERSDDGVKWYGVSVVLLPDDDCLNTVQFKHSVPSRYWRIRPLDFNGVESDDVWAVQALQLFHNVVGTNHDNIQDKVFLENRDRDYAEDASSIKGYYDLIDTLTEFSAFGLELPSLMLYISVSFAQCVKVLGRPLVIGDILEIPSEAQYSADLRKILKWMEVTDVSWSAEGYTPGWRPTMLRIVAQPAFASQETQDIFGKLEELEPDANGLVEGENGDSSIYQDYFDVSKTIEAEARDGVPERGAEASSKIRQFEEDEIAEAASHGVAITAVGLNPTGIYVEDAMPPNNAPFTEAIEFPENPSNGDYHRMIYEGSAKDVPARLYRYSDVKGRWVYLETDLRAQYNPVKPVLNEFITSPTTANESDVTQQREKINQPCEED